MDKKKIMYVLFGLATLFAGLYGYQVVFTKSEPVEQPEINNQNNGLLPSEDH